MKNKTVGHNSSARVYKALTPVIYSQALSRSDIGKLFKGNERTGDSKYFKRPFSSLAEDGTP